MMLLRESLYSEKVTEESKDLFKLTVLGLPSLVTGPIFWAVLRQNITVHRLEEQSCSPMVTRHTQT